VSNILWFLFFIFSFNWLCAFFVTFFQADMIETMTSYGVYFLYAGVCAVAVAFVMVKLNLSFYQ
jgi:hypothetical protein